jgi:TRAP-type uncharacterized transport system substrate-binding protein
MRKLLLGLGLFACSVSAAWAGSAETAFTILVGEPSWLAYSDSIARSLDHEAALRILPMVGSGSVQALQDLEQFKKVDAALVTSDSLAYVQAQNILEKQNEKFTYVAVLKPLPVYLLAKRNITNITQLAGKRIATGRADSASFATGELLLGAMEVPFLRVPQAQEMAIEALASGKADAALVLGRPQNLERLSPSAYHILPVVLPQQLAQIYQSATLTATDAPAFLHGDEKRDTVSTSLVLAVNEDGLNAEQRRGLKLFVTQYFKQPGNAEASLGAEVPGWQREANAAALLKPTPQSQTITPTGAQP